MAVKNIVTLASNGKYWQAQFYDGAGRKRAKSLGVKTDLSRRQAKLLCDRLAVDLQLNPTKANMSKAPRLGEFLDRYLKSRTDVSSSTLYLHGLTCRYLKQFFGPEIRIDRITRSGAADWRAALARGELKAARKNHQYQTMNETSVCCRTADAKVIFNQAVAEDLLTINPFSRLKTRPPTPDKNWHYVSFAELDKLLDACETPGWKALISLCRLAGLRRGEAIALEWKHVDWQERRLTIFAHKTGNKREVPLEPQLYHLLLSVFNAARDGQRLVCDLNTHCLWRNFNVLRKRAGLTKWKDAFQVMRRNAETDWAQRFPQYAVSNWIGHDITVSAKHYLQVPKELFDKAAGLAGEAAAGSKH